MITADSEENKHGQIKEAKYVYHLLQESYETKCGVTGPIAFWYSMMNGAFLLTHQRYLSHPFPIISIVIETHVIATGYMRNF